MDETSILDVRLGDIAGFGEALNGLTKSINDHDQADKRSICITLGFEPEANKVVIIEAACTLKLSLSEKFGSKVPMKSRLFGTDLLLGGEQGDLFEE